MRRLLMLSITVATVAMSTGLPAFASEAPKDAGAQEENTSPWFWGIGMTNYHCPLKESEGQIKAQINDVLGTLIGGWERPTTFKDWSDEFLIWSPWIFLGRDIGADWAWWIGTGGVWAPISNDIHGNVLGLPIKADVDFARAEWFISQGVTWFPFGKPDYPDAEGKPDFGEVLGASRPFLELGTGFVYLRSEAKVKVSMPGIGTLLKQEQTYEYHLFQVSPRAGVQIPISKNDRLDIESGYYVMSAHQSEFNAVTLTLRYSHRFGGKDKGK